MRRGLIDVRIKKTTAQRYVVELSGEAGFDERRDCVQIEQAQIRVGLGPVGAPCGAYDLRRLRRAFRHFEHIFMGVADRFVPGRELIQHRLFLGEHAAFEHQWINEHQRYVLRRLDRKCLALGDVHDHVLANTGGIEVRGRTADPAVLVAAVRRRCVPERNRREVRERRPVVTDTVHDGDLAVVVKALHATHGLVPAELRVDFEYVRFLDADRRPVPVVERVRVRDDGVQAVVAAEPFKHDEDLPVLRGSDAAACLSEQRRHGADATKQAQTYAASSHAQHVPPGNADFGQRILCSHEGRLPRECVKYTPFYNAPLWRSNSLLYTTSDYGGGNREF